MKHLILIIALIATCFSSMAKGTITLDKFNAKLDEYIAIALNEDSEYRVEGLLRPVVVLEENDGNNKKNLAIASIYYDKYNGKSSFLIDLQFTDFYRKNTYVVIICDDDVTVILKGTKSVNQIDYKFERYFAEYCREYLAERLPENSYSISMKYTH